MIEMTELQALAIERSGAACPWVNPRTKETFVLLPLEEYERLRREQYDDTPWTREELQAAAWATAEREEWNEYDDAATSA